MTRRHQPASDHNKEVSRTSKIDSVNQENTMTHAGVANPLVSHSAQCTWSPPVNGVLRFIQNSVVSVPATKQIFAAAARRFAP
jgi:hypothetical protein